MSFTSVIFIIIITPLIIIILIKTFYNYYLKKNKPKNIDEDDTLLLKKHIENPFHNKEEIIGKFGDSSEPKLHFKPGNEPKFPPFTS